MQTPGTAHGPTEPKAANFDEDGYLLDQDLWDQGLGQAIALQEGIDSLNERHWRIINHVRERYFALGGVPSMRRVCRATSISQVEVYDLFGSCLSIWRIAGLPNPGEEAKAYMH